MEVVRTGRREIVLGKSLAGIVYHHILRSNPSERIVFSVAVEAVSVSDPFSKPWGED